MYEKDGQQYFIVDSHVHLWDGRAANLKNVHGKQCIDCFYDYHRNLSPEAALWDYDTYTYYGGDRLMKDLFVDFEIPEDMLGEYAQITTEPKRKILGLNAASLYAVDVPAGLALSGESVSV